MDSKVNFFDSLYEITSWILINKCAKRICFIPEICIFHFLGCTATTEGCKIYIFEEYFCATHLLTFEGRINWFNENKILNWIIFFHESQPEEGPFQ